jgi:hypothetical protein
MFQKSCGYKRMTALVFFIDEKLAQHHGLPPREKNFRWSKNQPIRKSENKKTPL